MGGYTNFGSLDDGSTGDGIGLGLVDSTTDYSGSDPFSDGSLTSDVTGSDVSLDFSNGATGLGVSDLMDSGSLADHTSLSGVTETPPDASGDSGELTLDTNGEGSASAAGGAHSIIPGGDWTIALGSFGKLGASLAGVLTGNHPATIGGVPIGAEGSVAYDANGLPINASGVQSSSLSGNYTTVIVGVVIAIAVFLAFSDIGKKAISA